MHTFIDLETAPELLEWDMELAYPGLPSHCYISIAREAGRRHTGGSGGREWAMSTCKLAWLEENREPVADNMDVEYFG